MSTTRVRGITVQLGGDVSGISKALKQVNGEIKDTQSQLKDVERLLKLDPKNTELLAQKHKMLSQAAEETKTKLTTLKQANEEVGKSAKNYDAWKKAYDPIQDEIQETSQKLKELQAHQKELESAGKADTEAYRQIQQEAQEAVQRLTDLRQQAKAVSDEFGNPISPKQYDALQREIVATEQQLKDLEKQAGDSYTALVKIDQAGDSIQKVGGKITGAGKEMTKVTAVAVGLGGTALKIGADFEAGMSQVAAISGASKRELEQLKEKAIDMGAKTKFSATESAAAMNYMAMAGWKTGDMLNGIEGIMDLAAASNEDLALTSDIVTDALTAFGLTAKDSGHFADILAQASSNANTNVAMMGETFKYVAPVAGALGYTAEDVALATGLMANAGIKASQAGTSLRAILTRLVKPTENSALSMEELGISVANSDGSMKPLRQTMAEIRTAFSGLTEEEKAFHAANIAGQEAMSGFLSIVEASPQDFEKLARSIDTADGAAKRMAEIQMDNLKGEFEELTGGMETLAFSIAEILIPIAKDVVRFAQGIVDKLNAMDEGSKKNIVTIGLIVAAIGPLLMLIGGITTGVGGVVKAIGAAGKVFTTVHEAIGLFTGTATTGTAAAKALASAIGFITSPVGLVVAAIVGAVTVIAIKGEEIQAILQKVDDFLQNVFATDWREVFGPTLGTILNEFFANFSNIWSAVKQIFDGIIDFIRGVFTGNWERAWQGVVNIFGGLISGLVALAKVPINGVISMLNGMISAINWVIEKINSISFDNPFTGETIGFDFNTIGEIPYLAKGGTVYSGSAIVGEAGPELLTVAGGRAQVTPLTGGNSTTNYGGAITVNMYGNVEDRGSAYEYGKIIGEEAARIMRSKGVVAV